MCRRDSRHCAASVRRSSGPIAASESCGNLDQAERTQYETEPEGKEPRAWPEFITIGELRAFLRNLNLDDE
jgi:hypothetical protein